MRRLGSGEVGDIGVVDDDDDDNSPTGAFLDFAADLKLTLGNIHEEVKRAAAFARNQRRLEGEPNPYTTSGSCILGAGGVGTINFGSPQRGRIWTIRQIIASGQGAEQFTAGVAEANTSSFAAAAAGSVGLPSGPPNGVTQFITGFVVNIGPATGATGTTTITLNNVSGGPLTYIVQQSTTAGTTFQQTFPGSGLQVTGTPSLTISATANGGAGSLTLYGTASTTPGLINWYIGPSVGQSTPLYRWTTKALPGIDTFTTNLIQVRENDTFYGLVSGGIVNQTIVANLVFLDEAFKHQVPVTIA